MKNCRKFLWAMLPVAAAFALTACSSSDDAIEKESQTSAVKTIPYSVTIGSATTRATVGNDKASLLFTANDEIYITGENLTGHLTITSGVGQDEGQFDGSITYKGELPKGNTLLHLTLKSEGQQGLTIGTDNSATFSLDGINTFSETLQEAVQKFSYITGDRKFSFTEASLMQNGTSFIDFSLTLVGLEATSEKQQVTVTNADGAPIATGEVSVTPVVGQPTVASLAKFAIAVPQGSVMAGAQVTVGDYSYTFTSQESLLPKVYNVEKELTSN